ncbi:hypothetical protein [Roseateles sp. L2-2]|uniref:hypothetical protein n=1 Tax=Roseateles TaxID=93681 RepID=UPI003D35FA8B
MSLDPRPIKQATPPIREPGAQRMSPVITDQLLVYCLKITVLSLLAATSLQTVATFVVHMAGMPSPPVPRIGLEVRDWLGAGLLSPLLESLFVWAAGSLIRGMTPTVWVPSLAIGLIAGVAHGAIHPMWFFGPAASFTVFAWAWLRWRDAGRSRHFLILLIPHMLQNIAVLSLQVLVDRF